MERIKHYLGEFYDKKIILNRNDIFKEKCLILTNLLELRNNDFLQYIKNGLYESYIKFVKTHLEKEYDNKETKEEKIELLNRNILFLIGDKNKNPSNLPLLCKTRKNNNNIIFNFTRMRHMHLVYYLQKNPDINFSKKKNICIWRGSNTGKKSNIANRFELVENFINYNTKKIDIAFCSNAIVNGENVGNIKEKKNNKLFRSALSINNLLKYKYLISVEGFDVASGLKWMLYSNSIVLMAKPRNFSWIMEDKLIPNFHYILLKDDFSDLEEKIEWCNDNQLKCLNISKNATEYMKQFLDIKKEKEIEKEVLTYYLNNIYIK